MSAEQDIIGRDSFTRYCDPARLERRPAGRFQPFLDGYLLDLSAHISIDEEFYPELLWPDAVAIDPKTGERVVPPAPLAQHFDTKDSGLGTSALPSVFVLSGPAGVGKTSFINWWTSPRNEGQTNAQAEETEQAGKKMEEKKTQNARSVICDVLLSWSPAKDQTAESYLATVLAHRLRALLFSGEKLDPALSIPFSDELAREVGHPGGAEFQQGLLSQSKEFLEKRPFGPETLLALLIGIAHRVYRRPVWLCIDNVDLESAEKQEEVISAATTLFGNVSNQLRDRKWPGNLHICITVRPENYRFMKAAFRAFHYIDYATPQIHEIAIKKIMRAARHTSWPDGMILTSGEVKISSGEGFGEWLGKLFEACLHQPSWPWSLPPLEWHLALVNYNVRRLVKFWVHMMASGNFVDGWLLADHTEDRRPSSPYRYLRMMLRGPFSEFPGNERIEAWSYRADSPVFFNMFGLPFDKSMSGTSYCMNYLVYVRAVSFLRNHGPMPYRTFRDDIGRFFNRQILESAMRDLIRAGLIDDLDGGTRVLMESRDEILPLDPDSRIKVSKMGDLHLNILLQEYEYLSAMSAVSWRLKAQHERHRPNSEPERSAISTLTFLEGMKTVIVINLKQYRKDGLLNNFKECFVGVSEGLRTRLWQRSTEATIRTLDRVAQRTGRSESLSSVISAYKELLRVGTVEIQDALR